MKTADILLGAMLTLAVGCGSGEFVTQEADLAGSLGHMQRGAETMLTLPSKPLAP